MKVNLIKSFLILSLLLFLSSTSAWARNIAMEPVPEDHLRCMKCFKDAGSRKAICAYETGDVESCIAAYEEDADFCRLPEQCTPEALEAYENRGKPNVNGQVTIVDKNADISQAPLEVRKKMVQSGAVNVPLPELNDEEIAELKRQGPWQHVRDEVEDTSLAEK